MNAPLFDERFPPGRRADNGIGINVGRADAVAKLATEVSSTVTMYERTTMRSFFGDVRS